MAKNEIYSMRTISNGYRMDKFDEDFNFLASYEIVKVGKHWECSCPAWRCYCRHLQMKSIFIKEKAVNTGRMYSFDRKVWVKVPEIMMVQEA